MTTRLSVVVRPCRTLLISALIVAAIACRSSTAPTEIGGVVATARLQDVELTNHTKEPVFSFTVGRKSSALVDWAPCADAVRCQPLAPGDTRITRYVTLPGVSEDEVVVSWWHSLRGANGVARPDSIRSAIVPVSPR